MNTKSQSQWLKVVLLSILLSLTATHVSAEGTAKSHHSIMGGIRIDDGHKAGDLESVNGGISVGKNAIVGSVKTVNGGIKIGPTAKLESAETVNGGIRLSEGVVVSGNLETVNGGIRLKGDDQIGGNVKTVNGGIAIFASDIGGSLETVNGDISLKGKTVVKGDIVFHEPNRGWFSRWFEDEDEPEVKLSIGEHTIVKGTIHLYRPVKLEIEKGATTGKVVKHYDE